MLLYQWILELNELWQLLFLSHEDGLLRAALPRPANCCDALRETAGGTLFHPRDADYERSTQSYWSLKNAEVRPSCLVRPTSVEQISQVVQVLSRGGERWPGQCRFAIRSGGHTPFREAATLEDGIVIDLSNMPSAGLSDDQSSITVSPAAKWDDVYEQLDPLNLTVVGGRVAGVGVGGLVLGCGISYVSARHGFACDNVDDFQVVLASGSILNANSNEHPDLWKALRGGSNNFAIVTAVTLKTHRQGQFWGGQTFHKIEQRKEIFQNLENLIDNYDIYSHFLTTMIINGQMRSWFMGNSYQYTKSLPPIPITSRPAPFAALLDLKRTPVFPGTPSDTLRMGNMTSYSREYAALLKDKKRWTFASISFGNSAQMMEEFWQLTSTAVKPFLGIDSFQLSISFQPLPTFLTSGPDRINSLGQLGTQGNMFNVHLALGVGDEASDLDSAMADAVKTLFEDAERRAKESGLQRDYVPLTYADGWQRPIQRRGKGVVEGLRKVSQKYDAGEVFQKQVLGGFKLT